MAAYDLPSEFDVVIYGTGLTESVIAAACARVGQKVLHVDSRDYYCGNWASFTFNGLLSWIEKHKADHQEEEEKKTADPGQTWEECLEEGEEVLPLSWEDSISNLEVYCYASQEAEEEEECPAPVAGPHNGAGTEGRGQDGGTAADGEMTEESPENGATTGEKQGKEAQGEKEEVSPESVAATAPGEEEQGKEAQDEKEEVPAESSDDTQSSDAQTEPPPRPDSAESQSTEPPKKAEKKITYADILKEGRRFNIDLVSKLLYSRGPLVDLLIKSNVSRYTEFKNVTRILTRRSGKVEQVPCSRADVFSSKQLTVVEKRMLMKFLTFALDYEAQPDEYREFAERPFWDFLQTRKLTENLRHFLFHSIAMGTGGADATSTGEGLAATQHFLRCLGRYGNTPFLFSLYGLGEIPQAFCRMSAVFGGVYSLRHAVRCLVLDKETGRCKAVIDGHNKRIACGHFVVEEGYVIGAEQRKDPPSSSTTTTGQISRAVLITDRSVLPSDSPQQVSLVTVPSETPGGPPARLIELCSSTMTCMPGTFLVHLTCSSPSSSSGSAHDDLSPLVSRMFHTSPAEPGEEERSEDDARPTVLWAMYFNMRDGHTGSFDLPDNVYVCPGPDGALDSHTSIARAESVFLKILPEEEFCPPAPNPEDIIYDGDAPTDEAGFSQKEEEVGEGEGEETKEKEETEEEGAGASQREEGEGNEEETKEKEETQVSTQETATEPQEEGHFSTEE